MNIPPYDGVVVPCASVAEQAGLGPEETEQLLASWGELGVRPLRQLAQRKGIEGVREAVYRCLGVEPAELSGLLVPAKVLATLPGGLAEQGLAAAIDIDEDGTVVIAVSNPFDYSTGRRLAPVLADRPARVLWSTSEQIRALCRRPLGEANDDEFGQLIEEHLSKRAEEDAAAPGADDDHRGVQIGERLVEQLFQHAVAARATDIHIAPYRDLETGAEGFTVRFRIDGTARRATNLSQAGRRGLIAADIIARTLRIHGGATALASDTQDFRVYREIHGRQICGRVHTRPVHLGGKPGDLGQAQKTTVRLLDGRIRRLDALGFSEGVVGAWQQACRGAGRLAIVSGPTGSGKTTLLAATIPLVVNEEEVAYSIEDPVEYHHSLLDQIEVQATTREQRRQAMTAILFDLMREDPDFVMVGEIRDRDSMEMAFELALRGAQVLTTMHAGSAVAGVQRLLEWGLDPYVVVSNLGAVMNVRLLRRLCPSCRVPVAPGDGWPRTLFGRRLPEAGFAKAAEGCGACRRNGTTGQFGIGELLLLSGAPVETLRDSSALAALMAGRATLEDEAVSALASGATDLPAVLRAHIGSGISASLEALEKGTG